MENAVLDSLFFFGVLLIAASTVSLCTEVDALKTRIAYLESLIAHGYTGSDPNPKV